MHTDESKDKAKHQPAQFSGRCLVTIFVALLVLGGVVAGYMHIIHEFGESVAEADRAPPPDHWDEGLRSMQFAGPDAGFEDIDDADY